MFKNKIFRRLALLFSLITLLISTVNTTFAFIVTKTDSLINTFIPFDSVVSDLLIVKSVEHPFGEDYTIPDNIAFDFKVDFGPLYANTTIKTTVGNVMADENGSITVSVKPGNSIGIEGIDAGTKVVVTEIQKDGNGFSVKDGAATKEVTVSEDGSATIEFVNVYTPANIQPTNLTVGGIKILEGREWQSGDSFSFILELNTEGDTWKTLGTTTVTYDAENESFNKFDFGDILQTIDFNKVGKYSFRMTEVIGNLEAVDYDKTVNTFDVKVTDADMDGKLEISDVTVAQNATVTKDNGKFDVSVTFNNTFIPPVIPEPDDVSVNITVNKTVNNTGVSSIGPDGFEFVLENIANGEKITLDSDENGKAVFMLSFTSADIGKTYNYKLFETNEGIAGMTYDSNVYDISVTVSLGEDNKLNATMTMNGNVVDVLTADFENTYHKEQPDLPSPGDNSNNLFWFIVMIASAAASVALIVYDRKYARLKL